MKKSRTAVIVLILIFSTGCASLRSPVQLEHLPVHPPHSRGSLWRSSP